MRGLLAGKPVRPRQTIFVIVATRFNATPNSFKSFTSTMRHARCLADASAGSNSAARIAMMAITTSNSINVKARFI
jgi:hypothetical protein